MPANYERWDCLGVQPKKKPGIWGWCLFFCFSLKDCSNFLCTSKDSSDEELECTEHINEKGALQVGCTRFGHKLTLVLCLCAARLNRLRLHRFHVQIFQKNRAGKKTTTKKQSNKQKNPKWYIFIVVWGSLPLLWHDLTENEWVWHLTVVYRFGLSCLWCSACPICFIFGGINNCLEELCWAVLFWS